MQTKKASNRAIATAAGSPGQRIYSLPQYVSASNWIWLDSQVSYFTKDKNITKLNQPIGYNTKIYKQFDKQRRQAKVH